jgi:hypothetical protein
LIDKLGMDGLAAGFSTGTTLQPGLPDGIVLNQKSYLDKF